MKFSLNPSQLFLDNKPLVSDEAIDILNRKKIDLFLDLDESTTTNDKPNMVFIHGNSSSKKAFQEQSDYFSKICRVISIDLLGHGNSAKISDLDELSEQEKDILAENFYNPRAMIAELVQVLRSLNISQAHFVGWSLGGHLAYGVAVDAPELVGSITTIGSPPVEFTLEGLKKGFHDLFTNKMIPEWITNVTRNLPNLDKSAEFSGYTECQGKDKFFVEDLVNADPRMRKFLFLHLENHKSLALDGETFVKNTFLPLCLMVGKCDSGIKTEYYNQFENILRNKTSKVMIIDGAKHAVFRTHKDQFTSMLNQFMAVQPHYENQGNRNTAPRSTLQRLSLLAYQNPDDQGHEGKLMTHDPHSPSLGYTSKRNL